MPAFLVSRWSSPVKCLWFSLVPRLVVERVLGLKRIGRESRHLEALQVRQWPSFQCKPPFLTPLFWEPPHGLKTRSSSTLSDWHERQKCFRLHGRSPGWRLAKPQKYDKQI